ncbi:hypothetical protein [Paenibacillus sp. Marseille-Q4541]|uniref:hypothetical protein n=1 Tax=Paenibacillus sp. Marseille-Q4541 TaxID=2831522 RepID=UPI001BAA6836|nr:hypothetical protein [Paenibacillus sp. Marseille-Q4541]
MKANVNLEIDKDDLSYELNALVREVAEEEIRKMVKQQAEALVKEEIKRIIAPIVDEYLQDAQVGREHISYHDKGPSRRNIDDFIKRIIKDYLDEPVYLYSKDAERISERYNKSSQPYDKTRAELWVINKTIKFVDSEVFPALEARLKEVADVIVLNEEQVQEIIKAKVLEKFA